MAPDEGVSAADGARDEAARQAVALAFGILSVLVMVWAQRAAGDPDFLRSARMRAARAAERCYARLAAWSWRQAERARVGYERERA